MKRHAGRKLSLAQVRRALDQLVRHKVPLSVLSKQLDINVCSLRRDLTELHGSRLPLVLPPRLNRTPMSEERRNEMIRLRKDGWLHKEIAARFGISPSRVHQILRDAQRLGLLDDRSIVFRLRRQQIRREAYARKIGRSVWDPLTRPNRRRAA